MIKIHVLLLVFLVNFLCLLYGRTRSLKRLFALLLGRSESEGQNICSILSRIHSDSGHQALLFQFLRAAAIQQKAKTDAGRSGRTFPLFLPRNQWNSSSRI